MQPRTAEDAEFTIGPAKGWPRWLCRRTRSGIRSPDAAQRNPGSAVPGCRCAPSGIPGYFHRKHWARRRGCAHQPVQVGYRLGGSVPALVNQRPLLDPWHHLAQLGAHMLDWMLGELGAHRLERGLVHLVLEHPVLDEAARLNVAEDALHLSLGFRRYYARTGDVFAVFGGVGDRVVHVGDAALVDEVDDQLYFMDALEIRHLGRIAGLDQRLVAGFHQLDQAAAQHRLLTEQVGLACLLEGGLDNAGAAAADRGRIGQAEIVGVAGHVPVDRNQARHPRAALIFRAHGVARPLGGDHQHIDVGARLDEVEMHVEAVGEQERSAVLQVGAQVVAVDVALQFVRREHHDHVGPFGGLRHLEDLELLAFRLLDALRALAQRDRDFLDAGITQVKRMGVALAAIAHDRYLLAFDQIQVSVAVVIYAHFFSTPVVPQVRLLLL